MDKNIYDPPFSRTPEEAQDDKQLLMESVDEYVTEMAMWCDDEEDVLALGSILLVSAKNAMVSVMGLEKFKKFAIEYIKNVGADGSLSLEAIKRQP